MTNPIQLELPDLILLKKEIDNLSLPKSNKLTYYGNGEGKSLFKSRGLNFQEVRQYQPGDDIRQIDWHVTAKYGKPFTKLYEEEKERQVYILCDLRPPMYFASHGDFKSIIAGRLSALCAYMAERKNDSLSYQILGDKIYSSLPSSAKEQIPNFINQLTESDFSNDSEVKLNSVFPFISQNVRPGALIFFISDFHDIQEKDFDFFGHLSTKNKISLIHLYDKMEVEMPKGIFPCSNKSKTLLIDTEHKNFKQKFQESWINRTNMIRKNVQKYGLGYLSLSTEDTYLTQFKSFCLGE